MNYVRKLQEYSNKVTGKYNDAVYDESKVIVDKEHEHAVTMAVIDRAIEKRLNGGYLFMNNI